MPRGQDPALCTQGLTTHSPFHAGSQRWSGAWLSLPQMAATCMPALSLPLIQGPQCPQSKSKLLNPVLASPVMGPHSLLSNQMCPWVPASLVGYTFSCPSHVKSCSNQLSL